MRDPRFESFVREHSPALLRLAYLLTRDHQDAEDLVQEALLSVVRRWDRVCAAERPEAYVRRIVVNNHISSRRRASSHELPFNPDLVVFSDTRSMDRHDEIDARAWAANVLARLPDQQRAVLVLRYYERLGDQEIADLLGVARGTVRSLAARAFASLRQHPQLASYADPTDAVPTPEPVTVFRRSPSAPQDTIGLEGRG
jgi:RNA polymerase sigma-70 factor (sigma-E family)